MAGGVRLFDSPEFGRVRALLDGDGEPWFVAADVAKALGLGNPTMAVRNLDDDEKTLKIVEGHGSNLVSEAGFYKLVLRSRKPEAKAFQRWVTHEVLPALRRDGGYMAAADETPEETMARAVLLAQRTIERQRARISELEPKALFADAVGASDGTCLVGELAKMLHQSGVDVGQNRLFEWLREDGYLGRSGSNRNVPTQRSMEMGLFRIKETAVTHAGGHVTLQRTPKVTGKGQRYFVARYGGTAGIEWVA